MIKTIIYNTISNLAYKSIYKPKWRKIKSGVLSGVNIFASNRGIWKNIKTTKGSLL